MKAVIVGAGIVGLSTAWALIRSGHEVVVLEQGVIPNPLSASFDQHRMIRPHYGNQIGYTRMAGEAHGAWAALWSDLGVSHYAKIGVLAIDLGDHGWMQASRSALQETGTAFEVVDRLGIERSAPALAVGRNAWGLHAPEAGLLFADRIVSDLAKWLSRKGADLRPNCRVASLDGTTGRLALSNGEVITADRIVVAAGAWTGTLLPDLASRVRPVRSIVAYVEPPADVVDTWADGPALFLMTPAAHLYCLPPVDGSDLKFGGAPNLRPGDPNAPIDVTSNELDGMRQAFAPYLKNPNGYTPIRGAGGHYADPDDKRFIVEIQNNIVIVTGCGGRMFKFATLIGQHIADMLMENSTPERLKRWASGREESTEA